MNKNVISTAGRGPARRIIEEFFAQRPDLAGCRQDFDRAFRLIVECFRHAGTLFLCGNGGSFADALHISAELVKSFERRRPVTEAHARALRSDPIGKKLADELETGLRAVPLGLNGSLASAIWNDKKQPNIHLAQELYVMGRRGDVLLAISTSGNAKNVLYAMAVARVLGMKTIALTGAGGGRMAARGDVALRLPATRTCLVQEQHQAVYHALCLAVEAAFFPFTKN